MLDMAYLLIGIKLWEKRTLLNEYIKLANATGDACGAVCVRRVRVRVRVSPKP